MILAGFAEGATPSRGGIGLVAVPEILRSTAARGHRIVLVMSEPANPDSTNLVVPDADRVLANNTGAFGIVTFKAGLGSWAFSPRVFDRFHDLVRRSDFVLLHSLYSFPVLAGYLLARYYGKPYGVWPLGVLAPFQRRISPKKKLLYNRLFVDQILRHAAVIFYTAPGEREEAGDLGLPGPSVVIPHGIDVEEFSELPPRGAFRGRFLNGHGGPMVLFLARLALKKGLDLLIEAMKLVVARRPDAMLAIAGPADPPAFGDQVRRWVAESGIAENIVLTGPADPGLRREALADADVFALLSQAENFGFSVFEAMAAQVPVVVSDKLNYAGEIARRGAGFSVPRTPEKAAEAILRLIEDAELRRHMGVSGRELAAGCSWEENGVKLERTIESLLARRPLPADLLPSDGFHPTVSRLKPQRG